MKKILSISLLALAASAVADEGQWQPHQIKNLQHEFDRVGIELSAEQVSSLDQYPMNAVVGLGGCSASFVSNKGLVITNHHCAYGAIANNSTPQNNLIKKGFMAPTQADELPGGPQQRVYITEQVTDVTATIIKDLGELSGKARYDKIQDHRKVVIAQCESDPAYRCSVSAYHHGMEYFLTKQLMIKDVRLVYAPSDAVGNFGGDIDNFEYPRHVADFTFIRAYVGKDGKPANYSKDNVPYQPKSFLKVNASGIKKGDGILLAGYPGRTSRYKLATEIDFAGKWNYPAQVDMYTKTLEAIAGATAGNPALEVKYSSTVKSINNRMKKRKGLIDGFKATDIHGIKIEQEQALLAWIAQDAARSDLSSAHQELTQLLAISQSNAKRDFYFYYAKNSGLLNAASRLYRLAKENEKPNSEREIGYQARDINRIESRLKRMKTRFAASVDQKVWALELSEYLAQGSAVEVAEFNQALGLTSGLSQQQVEQLITPLYQQTQLTDFDTRLSWVGKSVAQFEQSDDAFIKLAIALYNVNIKFENERKEMSGQLAQVRPQYMKAIIAFNKSQNKPVYPDANSTLRISFGTVDGYPAKDGVYKTPFTTLEGLAAKVTGHEPFTAPQKLLTAIKARDYGTYEQATLERAPYAPWHCKLFTCPKVELAPFNSVPVNFLSSADTTGGNSGSPVMNGKGELVGLNFDSTYESITKDWYFNQRITRAIHVDIRYILWLMEHVDGAGHLIKEMDVVK
ncbi:MAG: S46 family peptidase [Gammaproteobacteria bacterium]|nr:S46 family peptidase [Gammaproteobacteria bacterium]